MLWPETFMDYVTWVYVLALFVFIVLVAAAGGPPKGQA